MKYKLYYFDSRGRCEISRLILAHAGIEFEDIRFTDDEWEKAKATGNFPSNQVPCLEVDGKRFGQSLSIARFLARETGIAGNNSLEQLKADAIVDSTMELVNKVLAWRWNAETDEAKAPIWNEISTVIAPKVFGNLDQSLEGTFFLGDHLTWCDIAFLDACFTCDDYDVTQFMTGYPRLLELRKRIAAVPKLAAYLAARPEPLYK